MSTCQCDRPTRDNAYICDNCLDDFAKLLGDITWIDEELDTTIGKQKGVDYSATSARSTETPLLFNAAASDARNKLTTELWTMVRFCVEEQVRASDPMTTLPDRNIIAMSRWLLWRVDGLGYNDMAHELIATTTAAVKTCQRTIDRPPDRRYAGPCSECKRDLYHRPDATEVTCYGCGQRWDLGEVNTWMRHQVGEHMEGKLVTVQEGATLLGRLGIATPVRAIYGWAADGRLTQVGVDPRQRRLYRWDDLVPLATRRAAS